MVISKEEIKQEIHKSFDGVVLGDGIGLKQAEAINFYYDQWLVLKARSEDEAESWNRISCEDIKRYWGATFFFDHEGMRFHLPALMMYCIDAGELGGVSCDRPGLLFHLSRAANGNAYSRQKFSTLTLRQIECVIMFMEYMFAEWGDDNVSKLAMYDKNCLEESIRGWKKIRSQKSGQT